MKPVQVMFDEKLLAALDARPEVKSRGRSAILRRVVKEYLERVRKESIEELYRKAYEDQPGLGEEFSGWEEEGQWPEE